MRRDYTNIGSKNGYTKEEIDKGILTCTHWQDVNVTTNKNLPFAQKYVIIEVIEAFRIPDVKKVDVFGAIHGYCLIGIEAVYKNGVARIYIADDGYKITPVAIDFEEIERSDMLYKEITYEKQIG